MPKRFYWIMCISGLLTVSFVILAIVTNSAQLTAENADRSEMVNNTKSRSEIEEDYDIAPGTCPPGSATVEIFARSILLESSRDSGCIDADIPSHMIDESAFANAGQAKLHVQFTWEALPVDARVQSILTISFEQNGMIVGNEKFSLTEETEGVYSINIALEIPENSMITATTSLVIMANPSQERVALEVGPLEWGSITNCASAQFFVRNDETKSQGDGVSFRPETTVNIVFENSGCGDNQLAQSSLIITRNGDLVITIANDSDVVAENGTQMWTWNQRDMNGEQVGDGEYQFSIQTNTGEWLCLKSGN